MNNIYGTFTLNILENNKIYPLTTDDIKKHLEININDSICSQYIHDAYYFIQDHMKKTICPTRYSLKMNLYNIQIIVSKEGISEHYYMTHNLLFSPILDIIKVNIYIEDDIYEITEEDYILTNSFRIGIKKSSLIDDLNKFKKHFIVIEYTAGYTDLDLYSKYLYPHAFIRQVMLMQIINRHGTGRNEFTDEMKDKLNDIIDVLDMFEINK